jgi:hypothetical protein
MEGQQMSVPTNLDALTELFRRLGAPHPEKWASSQIKEAIPQLHRYLWLREAWKCIVPEDSCDWIDSEIRRAQARPDAPYAGIGSAIQRCLDRGVDKNDLVEIVRGKQAQLLFSLSCLLDDQDFVEEELCGLGWSLFSTDDAGNPKARISGLHESVLETDPTGREMRPKKRG